MTRETCGCGRKGSRMLPLYQDDWLTFRFAEDRIIPRFNLEGVDAGRRVSVFKIDPRTGERLGVLATATVGKGGWVDLGEPILVRAGEVLIAVAGSRRRPFPIAPLLSRPGSLVGIPSGTRFAAQFVGGILQEISPMATDFKRGDHVEWNSEAGLVRGTIQKKVTSEITFKGYKRHASKEEPQYIIKSDTTDHIAIHKGSALKKIKKSKG